MEEGITAIIVDTTTTTILTTDALVAALMLLTVSGAFVSVTEVLRRDMGGVNKTGAINRDDLQTLILLFNAWTAPAARGWT